MIMSEENKRYYFNFSFFKIDPKWRWMADLAKEESAKELENILENKDYIDYFMHGTSHWLGIDGHDVGNYKQNNKSTILKPGMVFTVEPGIYFGENIKNIPQKYKNIGIRIEDNILVTESSHKILSNNIPKEITDIERILK